jgi:hypothetical protein
MAIHSCLYDRTLSQKLQSLGFARGNQMRLYGRRFEIVSEPIIIAHNLVVMDAIDAASGKFERVRIPLQVLKTAGTFRAAQPIVSSKQLSAQQAAPADTGIVSYTSETISADRPIRLQSHLSQSHHSQC